MLTSAKQRLDREDEGFTLIELMVVVLIIAILLAIAIPTFLGAKNSANARSAQSNLRNAMTAEQTVWTNTQGFSQVTDTTPSVGMAGLEPSLTWTTVAPTAGNIVEVVTGDTDTAGNAQAVVLQAFGKDGNCYSVFESNDPANSFTAYNVVAQVSHACSASTAPTSTLPAVNSGSAAKNPGSSWYTSW